MSAYSEAVSELWPDIGKTVPPEVLSAVRRAAPQADRSGELARESLELLRETSLLGLPVPERFHGAGAGLLECCAAQRALGASDPGLAIALNMHLSAVGLMAEHWRRRQDTSWLLMESIATQRRLLAAAFAEPGLGGSVSRSNLRARRTEGGWEVSGRKTPCSLAGQADLVLLHMQTDGEPAEVLNAVVPAKADGVRAERTWDTLGMRGSSSDTLVLDRCSIPDPLVFHRAPVGDEDDELVAVGLIWFCLTSTAVYAGLAQTAVEETAAMLRRLRINHLGTNRAGLPSFQGLLGEHVAALLNLEAACAGLAARMDAGADPRGLLAAALGVKQQSVRVVPAAIEAFSEACGGSSYARDGRLERLWRDAQAVRFHPPTPLATRQYLGRRALGLPAGLDLDESAPRLRSLLESPDEG
ncbi:oxidoreductase [Streptosporangium violaceochromogenes]|nr:oxidoreductase [Streptosporangium violaceochromogenes]